MFEIYDGREVFYQWDCKQKLIVKDESIKEVHIASVGSAFAYTVATYKKDNLNMCDVPDILLESTSNIAVYAYCTDEKCERTVCSEIFKVMERPKPDDYVPHEDIKKWSELEKRIDILENGGYSLVYKKTFDTWETLFDLTEIDGKPFEFKKAYVYIRQETGTKSTLAYIGTSEDEYIRQLGMFGTTPYIVSLTYEIENGYLVMSYNQRSITGYNSFTSKSFCLFPEKKDKINRIYIRLDTDDETIGFTEGTTIEIYAK